MASGGLYFSICQLWHIIGTLRSGYRCTHEYTIFLIFSPSRLMSSNAGVEPFNRLRSEPSFFNILLHVHFPRSIASLLPFCRRSCALYHLSSFLLPFVDLRFFLMIKTKRTERPGFKPPTLGAVSGYEDHFTTTPPNYNFLIIYDSLF